MNLMKALLVWLGMGAILSLGVVLAAKGSPWLLVLSGVAFVTAIARIGCSAH